MPEDNVEYDLREWTPCKPDCAYCCDLFYGHARPHPGQKRIHKSDELKLEDKTETK